MTAGEFMEKIIRLCHGNTHDVHHFLKVHACARLMGVREHIDEKTLRTLEIAAILHDIACPLCREKYGNAKGKKQEEEGMPLVRQFFAGSDLEPEIPEGAVYPAGHHHTLENMAGIDDQIPVEAGSPVNAHERRDSEETIRNTMERIFQTATGTRPLQSIYLIDANGQPPINR